MSDFYGELGVSRGASAEELRKAYRKLAAELHPDRHPGDSAKEARFKSVNHAYSVLSDPKKRALYDEFGEVGLREGFDPDTMRAYRSSHSRSGGAGGGVPFDLSDLFGGRAGSPGGFGAEGAGGFGDIFGDLFQGGVRGRRGPRKGRDAVGEVRVDFAEAIRGTEVTMTGPDGGTPLKVRIPPGADDGDRLRVPGGGSPSDRGGPAGDLVLTVRVSAHPHFERRGLDLHLDLPITVGEAYRGGKVRVPTPDGEVFLSVPRRAQSGQVVRLRGKGVSRKDQRGDLYVRFLVKLPNEDSPELERAVAAMEAATIGDVRGDVHL